MTNLADIASLVLAIGAIVTAVATWINGRKTKGDIVGQYEEVASKAAEQVQYWMDQVKEQQVIIADLRSQIDDLRRQIDERDNKIKELKAWIESQK